ncbi:hypothetical protein Q1695_004457 [Nippostrongylus brasiliensis]|nr:hypothetical protein Q1695_004457 [Nippostrongylus brasiliensis]
MPQTEYPSDRPDRPTDMPVETRNWEVTDEPTMNPGHHHTKEWTQEPTMEPVETTTCITDIPTDAPEEHPTHPPTAPPTEPQTDRPKIDRCGIDVTCREGFTCVDGREICTRPPPCDGVSECDPPRCFIRPTTCIMRLPGTMEPPVITPTPPVVTPPESSGEGSGSGSGAVQCGQNMMTSSCGPLCPATCSQDVQCDAIKCFDEDRCFCNPGFVLIDANDLSAGCVSKEECDSS